MRKHADICINLTTQARPFLFAQSPFDVALYHGPAGRARTVAHFMLHEQVVPVCSTALSGQGMAG